jgi:drug/metabolite transporter (DMT)-like permease
LVLTVFGSACAYLIYYRLLAAAGATNASLVAYLIPVVAVLLGAAILDERFLVQQLLGMALIVGGMAVIDGRLVRRLANRGAPSPIAAD